MKFHHLYQFIPVTDNPIGRSRIAWEDIAQGHSDSLVRHDLWHKDGLSGRLVCKVTLCTPTVVGNTQEKATVDRAGSVHQYQRNNQPALPANSLRGMIGSVIEALSQSALRVLENKEYSVRTDVSMAMKHVGQLNRVDGQWVMTPLIKYSVPTATISSPIKNQIERDNRFYAAIDDQGRAGEIVHADEWQAQGRQAHFKMGRLRVVDAPAGQMPDNRKNELFLRDDPAATPLPVSTGAVAEFTSMVMERQAAGGEELSLPFPVIGQPGWLVRDDNNALRPAEGITVYYREAQGKVTKFAPAAIWRDALRHRTYDFFSKIDSDVLPWGIGRENLTPAEAMLGVVSGDGSTPGLSNLASRIRFGDALPAPGVKIKRMPETTLKILSSPKPPSPAMYFHRPAKDGYEWIAKSDLHTSKDLPNGRKVYLHHQPSDIADQPWRTRRPDEHTQQKLRCRPLEANQSFWFSIDFQNLSPSELGLLRAGIDPSSHFQHRLGLGKPLGLGSVKVEIEGLFLVDRAQRYAMNGLDTSRYQCVVASGHDAEKQWQALFPREAEALLSASRIAWEAVCNHEFIHKETYDLLNVIGNPQALQANVRVQPPMAEGQTDSEHETFKWFVENNKKGGRQILPPPRVGKQLPTLNRSGPRRLDEPPELKCETDELGVTVDPAIEWLENAVKTLVGDVEPYRYKNKVAEVRRGADLAKFWSTDLNDQPGLKARVKAIILNAPELEYNPSKKAKAIYNGDD